MDLSKSENCRSDSDRERPFIITCEGRDDRAFVKAARAAKSQCEIPFLRLKEGSNVKP